MLSLSQCFLENLEAKYNIAQLKSSINNEYINECMRKLILVLGDNLVEHIT